MNVSTYNDIFVEELYLNGLKFSIDNFQGDPGNVPTIDPDATEYQGADGDNWTLRYQTVEISEDDVGTYLLPDPASKDANDNAYDYTAFHIMKKVTTSGNINVYTHDNKHLMGILYASHIQSLHLFRSPDNKWVK
jgi:hypothetical protein